MKRIASFEVDHIKLNPGLYISRIDGDIITYDLRFLKPNQGIYLSYACIHSLEHLLATYLRNSKYQDSIIYVGPMGCRTGFYVLTSHQISQEALIKLLQEIFKKIVWHVGNIPGVSAIECGNYLEHDLKAAQLSAQAFLEVISSWSVEQLSYEYQGISNN